MHSFSSIEYIVYNIYSFTDIVCSIQYTVLHVPVPAFALGLNPTLNLHYTHFCRVGGRIPYVCKTISTIY